MSGSFWKFGQDYSTESAISKLLNRAFIKINDEESRPEGSKENKSSGILSIDEKTWRKMNIKRIMRMKKF